MIKSIPEKWMYVTLDEVTKINPRHTKNLDESLPVTFTPMTALSENNWDFKQREERPLGEVRKGYTHFAEGDVLLAKITPCLENGKAAIATNLKNGLGCGTTELHVLRSLGAILPEYLYYFLYQESFRREAAANFTGTAGQLRVPVSFLSEAHIPLPPLNEQRRIIEKLEHLLAKVNAARERLERIPQILKRFRQAVLAAAVSGELTRDWREKNRKIQSPSTSSFFEQQTHSNKPSFERRSYSEIPENWQYVALGSLGDWYSGGTPSKSKLEFWENGTIPWISPKDMKSEIILDSLDHITHTAVSKTRMRILDKGTILFVVRGLILARHFPVALTGISSTINQDIRAIKPNQFIISKYLLRVLQAENTNILFSVKEATHGTRRLESSTLKNWPIPLPSLEEQKEIVKRIEALFQVADRIEARYQKAKAQVDKLAQSILAKAFRGELVPQDPNDEPAAALLERIKAEKDQKAPGDQNRRRKGR